MQRATTRMERAYAEFVSGYSHLLAVGLSIAGLVALVLHASLYSSAWHVAGFAVFGASLILLYAASSLYHLLPLPEAKKQLFRKLDHIMIYVLIAGTYTPVCLTVLRGPWGWSILGVVWACALGGLFLKTLWFRAPRKLSTTLYVVMGWIAIAAAAPLVQTVGWEGVGWLIVGGALYTIGALIYALEWPTWHPRHFTFHELFHLWVMAGSLAHFWFMWAYVLPAPA